MLQHHTKLSIIDLKKITDERGMIMHMLKSTDSHFIEFGEIYFSCGYPGVVKAWSPKVFAESKAT